MRDELANAPEEWRDRAISGSAKPRLDHLLPRGRGPVRLPLSKWEDQDESHLTGRELLGFDLTEKATWELVLPEARGVSKRDGGGVEIVARDGLTVQVDGPESLEIDPSAGSGAVIRCLLPPGKTGVRLKVSSRPAYKLGRTVVLCRPDQWKEAAIVASCLPGDRFTPLIVVDPPPLSSKEHEALFAELTAVVSKTMEYRGTDWAQFELAENRWATPLEVVRTEARLQELLLQIAPQRSWLRHNDLVFQILRDLPLDRAVLLFPAQEGDLRAAGPEATDIPGQTMPPETRSILPEGVRRLYFLPAGEPAPADHEAHPYGDLAELAKLAWEALGPSGLAPGRTVDVPETSSSAFLTGLRRALIEGVPLRPVASGGDGDDATDGNRGIESDEAVLVEDSGHASAVVGVLYAHHRRAKLVTAPKQELGPLKAAFDEAHARRARFAEDQALHRCPSRRRGRDPRTFGGRGPGREGGPAAPGRTWNRPPRVPPGVVPVGSRPVPDQ